MDKNRIIAHFGMDFYDKLILDMETYKARWDLTDLEQIDYYSVHCIFKCTSKKYGPCILKIGRPSPQTDTEVQTLKEYGGGDFCRLYQADTPKGVLLLERIIPGIQLRQEPCLNKRLDVFCGLWSRMHMEPADKAAYPTYMEWVSGATEYLKGIRGQELLYGKMLKAEQICRSLCEQYPGELLLHGDLHHDNILLDENNRYRIIDPKGVIGAAVFDIPRFVLNEFEDSMDDGFVGKYATIIGALSKKLSVPEYDIRRLTYAEMCMANSWSVESGEAPNMEEVLFTEKMMDEMR